MRNPSTSPSIYTGFKERLHEMRVREESLIPKPLDPKDLEAMTIPQRYERLVSLATNGVSRIDALQSGHLAQRTLLYQMGLTSSRIKFGNLFGKMDAQKANQIIFESELSAMDELKNAGLKVDYHQEPSDKDIAKRPNIFFCTHQGAGMETLFFGAVTGKQGTRVLKDKLMGTAVLGDILKAAGSIEVRRRYLIALKNSGAGNRDISAAITNEAQRVANEMANRLKDGENLIVYPGGTRDEDGTPKLSSWFKKMIPAIDKATRGVDHQRMLVTWNTMAAFPDALEEPPFYPMRFNALAGMSASMVRGDNLNAMQMHQRFTSELTAMLNKRILNLQEEILEANDWVQCS